MGGKRASRSFFAVTQTSHGRFSRRPRSRRTRDPRWLSRIEQVGQRRDTQIDQRTCVVKTPHNKLSECVRQRILSVANMPEYADLLPSQIVPKLADAGLYIASESSLYRVLKEAHQLTHRQAS